MREEREQWGAKLGHMDLEAEGLKTEGERLSREGETLRMSLEEARCGHLLLSSLAEGLRGKLAGAEVEWEAERGRLDRERREERGRLEAVVAGLLASTMQQVSGAERGG